PAKVALRIKVTLKANITIERWDLNQATAGATVEPIQTMSIIRKRFASPNQYSWDAASAHKASRLSRLRRPQVALVIDELQRVVQDPDPVKPRLLYELDDGLLCSAQADGDHWLCIPDTIKDEIFDIVHGDGYLDFYRDIRELRSFALRRVKEERRAPILAQPIPFHTLSIDFVIGLPRTKKGVSAVAIYTCRSTKRIGSAPVVTKLYHLKPTSPRITHGHVRRTLLPAPPPRPSQTDPRTVRRPHITAKEIVVTPTDVQNASLGLDFESVMRHRPVPNTRERNITFTADDLAACCCLLYQAHLP
ncbi:hypothetical protein N7505_011465, partial [Penicillium chrysogenum]